MKQICYGCEKPFEVKEKQFYYEILNLTFHTKRCAAPYVSYIKKQTGGVMKLMKVWPYEFKSEEA